MSEFSDVESQMFETLGMGEVLRFAKNGIMSVSQLYQATSIKCFLDKTEGPAVESLRRCFSAFKDNNIHRSTPEWDALIQLEEDKPTFSDGSPVPIAPGPLHYEPSAKTRKENS